MSHTQRTRLLPPTPTIILLTALGWCMMTTTAWAIPYNFSDGTVTGQITINTTALSLPFTDWVINAPILGFTWTGAGPAAATTTTSPPTFVGFFSDTTTNAMGDMGIFSTTFTVSDSNPSLLKFNGNIITIPTSGDVDVIGVGGAGVSTPEPTALLMMGTGLLALAGYRWHQRRREGTQVG